MRRAWRSPPEAMASVEGGIVGSFEEGTWFFNLQGKFKQLAETPATKIVAAKGGAIALLADGIWFLSMK